MVGYFTVSIPILWRQIQYWYMHNFKQLYKDYYSTRMKIWMSSAYCDEIIGNPWPVLHWITDSGPIPYIFLIFMISSCPPSQVSSTVICLTLCFHTYITIKKINYRYIFIYLMISLFIHEKTIEFQFYNREIHILDLLNSNNKNKR